MPHPTLYNCKIGQTIAAVCKELLKKVKFITRMLKGLKFHKLYENFLSYHTMVLLTVNMKIEHKNWDTFYKREQIWPWWCVNILPVHLKELDLSIQWCCGKCRSIRWEYSINNRLWTKRTSQQIFQKSINQIMWNILLITFPKKSICLWHFFCRFLYQYTFYFKSEWNGKIDIITIK